MLFSYNINEHNMDIVVNKSYVNMENINSVLDYQVADIQRLLNEEYILELLEDQRKEYNKHRHFSVLQSITCADFKGKRYILDGQHRVEMFRRLKREHYPLYQYIPVVIYNTSSMEEMVEYYRRINRNNPVNPLEISDMWFNYGKELCSWLVKLFPSYCKTSANNCMSPHISMHAMVEYLKQYRVFERVLERSDGILLLKQNIVALNDYITIRYNEFMKFGMSPEFSKRCAKCAKKCPTKPCFLGMWRRFEWIEICLYMIATSTTVDNVDLYKFARERDKIPKTLRTQVWNKRNGNTLEGGCYVCNRELCYENMECGHVVPFAYNGSVELENLEPICKTCNRDMGIMHLNEYKKLINNSKHYK